MNRQSEFRLFLMQKYMENCDERLQYKQTRVNSDKFIQSNIWWLKKMYRETQKGAVI